MSKNSELLNAGKNKKDEFYTQLSDIEKELKHYKKHFKGKTVLCNCDDPFESNFFKYFCLNFNKLGLKKLIATSYSGSPIAGDDLDLFEIAGIDQDLKEGNKTPYKAIVTTVYDKTGDGELDMDDIEALLKSGENELSVLKGNGDFQSRECKELLKEADIVVTNPPFSLWRVFIDQLMRYNKKFIVIGNINAVTYKEIFPLVKDNKIWLGPSIHSGDRKFHVPDNYPLDAANCGVDEDGRKWVRVKGVRWFTNLDFPQRHEDLILVEKYNPEKYPKFDNYNAINIDKSKNIPYDFEGPMAVPITFLDKYNPEQFEILNANDYRRYDSVPVKKHGLIKDKDSAINGKPTYARVLIKNKHPEVAE